MGDPEVRAGQEFLAGQLRKRGLPWAWLGPQARVRRGRVRPEEIQSPWVVAWLAGLIVRREVYLMLRHLEWIMRNELEMMEEGEEEEQEEKDVEELED